VHLATLERHTPACEVTGCLEFLHILLCPIQPAFDYEDSVNADILGVEQLACRERPTLTHFMQVTPSWWLIELLPALLSFL
jgi:hypothetical protein